MVTVCPPVFLFRSLSPPSFGVISIFLFVSFLVLCRTLGKPGQPASLTLTVRRSSHHCFPFFVIVLIILWKSGFWDEVFGTWVMSGEEEPISISHWCFSLVHWCVSVVLTMLLEAFLSGPSVQTGFLGYKTGPEGALTTVSIVILTACWSKASTVLLWNHFLCFVSFIDLTELILTWTGHLCAKHRSLQKPDQALEEHSLEKS